MKLCCLRERDGITIFLFWVGSHVHDTWRRPASWPQLYCKLSPKILFPFALDNFVRLCVNTGLGGRGEISFIVLLASASFSIAGVRFVLNRITSVSAGKFGFW